jgi:hypothetical protein
MPKVTKSYARFKVKRLEKERNDVVRVKKWDILLQAKFTIGEWDSLISI